MRSKIIQKLVTGLKESINGRGFKSVVVGLSGGLDSALAAKLAVDALGKENVHLFFMPHVASNPKSKVHAEIMANYLEIPLTEINITPITNAFEDMLGEGTSLAAGNIMSRVRMTILFDRSAALNSLVLGTANKSELFLGYNTIFGDSASAVNPLGDLYKTQVKEISEMLGLPSEIINKAPSADHREGQTDEGDIGYTYENMDRLLVDYVESKIPVEKLNTKYGEKMVNDLLKRFKNNRYKLSVPEIISIGQNSLNSI